ncbi:transcription factor S-II, central domain-containing protein [Syncephalis plumigaleata]|nr:transcription factor S-II, central domain-containing protein [Syncephalis plumigaleata]
MQRNRRGLFDYLADRSDRSNGPKCGQEYKSKFRSLIFGLNDKKNDSLRFGVLSGQVTSSVLVRMSNEDMANEELRNLAQDVREQGIRDSVIEDIDLSAYVKKTHKGEVMLGDTRPSADDDTRRITGSNNSSSGTRKTTTATTSSSSSSVSRRASESATSSMATTPITATFAESDRKRMDQHDNNDPLSKFDKVFDRFEALDSSKTSKNESDTTSASVAGSSSLDVKSTSYSSGGGGGNRSSGNSKSQNGKVLPTIWQGRLFMPDVADLQCTASQVAGQSQLDRVAWDNLLPTALSVDGRIHVGRTDDYLRQIIQSSTSKQLLLVRFNPPHAKEHASAYQTLWSYFNTRHRYGVVGYTLSSVKDMYIVPISTTQAVLPSFMNLLDYRPDTASSNKHYLLGVIVWNQPKSTTAAAASSSSSSTATSYHKQSGHRQRKPRSTTPPLPPPLPSTSSSLSIMTKNTANTAAAVTATATADSSNNGNLGTNGLLSPNTSVAQLLAQLNYPASTATATTTATSSLLNNECYSKSICNCSSNCTIICH